VSDTGDRECGGACCRVNGIVYIVIELDCVSGGRMRHGRGHSCIAVHVMPAGHARLRQAMNCL